MKINLGVWFQVVEYGLARQLLYIAGMGQRKTDADHMKVFLNRGERGFYVSEKVEKENKEVDELYVDEGMYSNSLHISTDNPGVTVSRNSDGWCEYVDAVELMSCLVTKLVPNAKIKQSDALGAGRRQQDYMDQYKDLLLQWSKDNPEAKLKFY